MKKLALILLTVLSANGFAQRQEFNINRSWQFTPGWEVQKNINTEINIPHTFNLDALSGKPDYYRGMSNYYKPVDIPSEWKNKKVFIRFKGSNQTTDLYIGGKHVGCHKGGYTAFTWDITPYLTFGAQNFIWARVTNALNLDVMPLLGDFNMYGGIYRDVDILVVPKIHISLEDYGSSGVYIEPKEVSDASASFTVRAMIKGAAKESADVKVLIRNAEGTVIDSAIRSIKMRDAGDQEFTAAFTIENPHLWNSTIDPYLYRAEVTVTSKATATNTQIRRQTSKIETDQVTENFGLRYFSVDKDNQFMLNGKPFRIQGVGKHQDWAMLGNAIFPENHQRDVQWMLDMGVNAVRLAHYPQDPYLISLCDKAGIIVWSEIPFVGPGGYRDKGFNDSESFKNNGKQQLREMIRQLYNHPSILFWGLFNEVTQRGDDPLIYIRELNEICKDEDPTRITVAASNQDGELNFVTDLIGFNTYLGWYGGTPNDIDRWGSTLRRDWSKLKVGISEYGAGASIYQHSDTLSRPVPTSYWHPEQWQTFFHREHWKTIVSKNYFWGTFIWAMFDFGAAHRTEGLEPGINDKGLVTFDRRVAKDAFYFYKANWNKNDQFVYISERRWERREKLAQNITIFSNQPSVELTVNGAIVSTLQNDGLGTFSWKNIQLKQGANTILATSTDGLMDRITITIIPNMTLPSKK